MNPVSPDITQPAMKANVRAAPDALVLSASTPDGFKTFVEVTKTMIANGTKMTAIVLN